MIIKVTCHMAGLAMDTMVISLNELFALKAGGSEVRKFVQISECIAHVLQFHARDKEGSGALCRWTWTRAYAVKDEKGKVLRWVGTNTKINNQKKAEVSQEAKNM